MSCRPTLAENAAAWLARVLVAAALVLLPAGCPDRGGSVDESADAGRSDAGTGGSEDAGDSADAGEPHDAGIDPPDPNAPRPFCKALTEEPSYPDDLGAGCAAGSNLNICLMGSSQSFCSTGRCLWDALDPTGKKAYCTAICKLNDPKSCPESFTCKVEDCENTPVCVRTSVPTPPALEVEVHEGVLASNYLVFALGIDSGGLPYWANSAGAVFRWSGMLMESLGTVSSNRGIVALEAGGALYLAPDAFEAELAVVKNGAVKTRRPDRVYVEGLFAAADGTVYFLEREIFFEKRSRFVPIDSELQPVPELAPIPLDGLALKPYRVKPLRSFGFVGLCDKSGVSVHCASPDGRDIRELTGDLAKVKPLATSLDPDSLWAVIEGDSDTSTLARWNGTEWVEEDAIASVFPRVVAALPVEGAANNVLAFNVDIFGDESEALLLDGTCWQPLHDFRPKVDVGFGNYAATTLLQLDADRVAWIDSYNLTILRRSSFGMH